METERQTVDNAARFAPLLQREAIRLVVFLLGLLIMSILFSFTIGHTTEYGLKIARFLLGRYTKGEITV